MKKVFALLVLAVLVIGVIVVYRTKKAEVELSVEKILPANPMIYVHLLEIEKRWENFKATPLWQNIKKIDMEKVLEKSGLGEQQREKYEASMDEFSGFLSGLLLDRCFGREIAFAVYSSEIKEMSPQALQDVASNIVLVSRLKPGAEVIEMVTKIYTKFNKEIVAEEESYEGHKITVIPLNDYLNISYLKIKDLLIQTQ